MPWPPTVTNGQLTDAVQYDSLLTAVQVWPGDVSAGGFNLVNLSAVNSAGGNPLAINASAVKFSGNANVDHISAFSAGGSLYFDAPMVWGGNVNAMGAALNNLAILSARTSDNILTLNATGGVQMNAPQTWNGDVNANGHPLSNIPSLAGGPPDYNLTLYTNVIVNDSLKTNCDVNLQGHALNNVNSLASGGPNFNLDLYTNVIVHDNFKTLCDPDFSNHVLRNLSNGTVQAAVLANVALTGSYNDLSNRPSGGSSWSALTNPTGSLALTMGANTSVFTYGAATGSADLFQIADTTNNTGTGALLSIARANNSKTIGLRLKQLANGDNTPLLQAENSNAAVTMALYAADIGGTGTARLDATGGALLVTRGGNAAANTMLQFSSNTTSKWLCTLNTNYDGITSSEVGLTVNQINAGFSPSSTCALFSVQNKGTRIFDVTRNSATVKSGSALVLESLVSATSLATDATGKMIAGSYTPRRLGRTLITTDNSTYTVAQTEYWIQVSVNTACTVQLPAAPLGGSGDTYTISNSAGYPGTVKVKTGAGGSWYNYNPTAVTDTITLYSGQTVTVLSVDGAGVWCVLNTTPSDWKSFGIGLQVADGSSTLTVGTTYVNLYRVERNMVTMQYTGNIVVSGTANSTYIQMLLPIGTSTLSAGVQAVGTVGGMAAGTVPLSVTANGGYATLSLLPRTAFTAVTLGVSYTLIYPINN